MRSDLWRLHSFQYNQFINQNTRLKETTSGLSSLSTNVASTPKSQSITSNSHDVASSYSSNPFHKGPNGDLSSNSIDYDFNINAIKTLLMTSKVPESCVWSVGERETESQLFRSSLQAACMRSLSNRFSANFQSEHVWFKLLRRTERKVRKVSPCRELLPQTSRFGNCGRCQTDFLLCILLFSITHPISNLIYWEDEENCR